MARTYSKTSKTWMLFDKIFQQNFGKDKDGNWIRLECDSRGLAINLTQGLNACNMQFFRESGMPLDQSNISARPAQDKDGNWFVQIGPSYKHRGRNNEKLEAMLQTLAEQTEPAHGLPQPTLEEIHKQEDAIRQKKGDDLIANMFNLNGGNDEIK